MPSIGPLEVLFVGVIALIVFGPKRLPEIARSVGKTVAELRRQANEVRAEFEAGLDADAPEAHPPPEAPEDTRDADGDG